MAVRASINDFIRDVRARTVTSPVPITYVANLNADNVSLSITRNGVQIYPKVLWNVQGSSALTDASSPNQDCVTILDPGSGYPVVGSAQQFINSLN